MNDSLEVFNSVELDEMTSKAIELVASEIEEKIRGNLQIALHEAATKELAKVKSNVQIIENKIAKMGEEVEKQTFGLIADEVEYAQNAYQKANLTNDATSKALLELRDELNALLEADRKAVILD